MPYSPNESHFEQTTIDRLQHLGYRHELGNILREQPGFSLEKVVWVEPLREHLTTHYAQLPPEAINQAIHLASHPEGFDSLHRNLIFHQMLTRGFDLKYKPSGTNEERYEHIYLVDWDHPERNDFCIVNQLPIKGQNDRRPDVIIYINGLPLVVFELKNPYDEAPTVEGAYNQIQHYRVDIPQLFDFNTFCVVSDGTKTLHGMFSASMEWFAPWKSINGRTIEPATTASMKVLVEGLFTKDRLLEYIRQFILFEIVNDVITKKGAKYHQFFGVRFAVEQALRATQPEGDRKIGVIWHTQGSGKSLSMIFLVGILQRRLENPTFLVEVDRTDLDRQLFDAFQAARGLVGQPEEAENVEDLRKKLQTEGGGVYFTTIEKFRLQEGEITHPILTDRRNVVVIADEAHRSQYGFAPRIVLDPTTKQRITVYGFGQYLRQALPKASFIGFTGTPIDKTDKDTQEVFGNIVHTYDIIQAQEDGAIVPIYYEPRMVKLHLAENKNIDEEFEEIAQSENEAAKLAQEWTTIEAAAGAQERLAQVAQDIVTHYEKRSQVMVGKGMIVCMSRRICVGLFEEIIKLRPDWIDPAVDKGQIKIVMTGDLSKDPVEWNQAGHITTKDRRERIKARLKDINDPLKLVIVCDMWLTGTDIPCLHTLYIDKPMKDHNLMQAIARVNRVFEDKPGGLVVDYIGIGSLLKKAARKYTADGFGSPAEELQKIAVAAFMRELDAIRCLLPNGITVDHWRQLTNVEFEDLCARLYGYFVEEEERRNTYLLAEKRFSASFSLVQHLPNCAEYTDEVAFFQMVRVQLKKTLPPNTPGADSRGAVRDLVDRCISSEAVVDIYDAAGLDKPDISILDEKFLEEFKWKWQENLRLKLLDKLLQDEITLRQRKNLRKYTSFKQMLEEVLKRYHAQTITAAEVVQEMIKIRQAMLVDDGRKHALNLSDEELAFYDAIYGAKDTLFDEPFLTDLVHDVVQAIKGHLKVDWTLPHRADARAEVMSAVKWVLRKKKIKTDQFDKILGRVMEQAVALYEEWPVVIE